MDNIFKKYLTPITNQHQQEKMTGPQNSDSNFLRNRSGSVVSQTPSTPTTPTGRKTSVDQDNYFYFM